MEAKKDSPEIEAIKQNCHYNPNTRCCANCLFIDYADKEFSMTSFCSNPKNENASAKLGENYTFSVVDCGVCDFHQFRKEDKTTKESNGNG